MDQCSEEDRPVNVRSNRNTESLSNTAQNITNTLTTINNNSP